MSKGPRISIITPSLNRAEYLEDAILSIVGQGYENVEHIVVDGGSRDGTIELLQRYPHIRWVSEPDEGQSDAINKGFRMASGDLVAWLNDDEYYLPGALQEIAGFATNNPDTDIMYGDSIFVDECGKLLRAKTEHNFDFGVLLYRGCYIQSCATFFRRRLMEERLSLDINYRVCMDYEYFVRLGGMRKTFTYLPRPLAAFRWHGSNRSLEVQRMRKECLQIQRKWAGLELPGKGYTALAHLLWAKRIVLKLCNGGYWYQLKARRHRGIDTRWFRSGGRDCSLKDMIP